MHIANTSTLPHAISSHSGTEESSGQTSTSGLSVAEQKLMPPPGAIYDRRWKVLPQHLQSCTLSRFDQDKCPLNHGISERAMCTGLSISWLKMVTDGDKDMSLRQSINRMSHLGSFEGVVRARVAHNYYRTEHQFRLDHLDNDHQVGLLKSGNDSLVDAAKEMAQLDLKAQLSDDILPFYPLVKYQSQALDSDPKAQQVITQCLQDTQQGIYTIYADQGSHAMAFIKQPDSDDIMVFDPNHGEFKTTLKDFHLTIEQLCNTSGLKPIFAQVFAPSR